MRLIVSAGAMMAIAVSVAAPAPAIAVEGSIDSPRGSGVFGSWAVDREGLPAYDYELDEDADPRAQQPELNGDNSNWSQLGNDAIVANAYNHGYTELWSSARLYQWANRFDASSDHFAGGFGWLRLEDGRVASTLYSDRSSGSRFGRRFGVGYYRKRMRFAGISVVETTTTPFGDDPALVDEVRISNRSDVARRLSWWEYWDVNPWDETNDVQRGLAAPESDGNLLTVAQQPGALDDDPLSIFLAADARVDGFEADTDAFFGSGDRAVPEAVASDEPSGSLAPAAPEGAAGRAMFATRTPLHLRPGRSVTLRFVYGIAHPRQVGGIVRRATRPGDTASASAREWARWLPRVDLGGRHAWLARELVWDAYMTRSASLYEESCGHHVITQGGYYQYGAGGQWAFRDPLQHLLPMIYADPKLARDVLIYSLRQQQRDSGDIAYGMGPMCTPMDLGTTNDFDFWLIQAVAEYVLATRDTGFLSRRVPYQERRGRASVWRHLRLAVDHQESPPLGLGPADNYVMGSTGDWSDFASSLLPATESVLVTAQLAYAYPRLAEVAVLSGRNRLARRLRSLGARDREQVATEWTGRGWVKRGYFGTEPVGTGAEYLEPQPWAVLSGALNDRRERKLVASTERFLQGVGAPGPLNGPSAIGVSQSPAEDDPEVDEFDAVDGVGDGNAVYVGGTWYALNGPWIWALGELVGTVPDAAGRAFEELKRNTLTAHATAFPEHWTGVLNVDDACSSFYATAPDRCGIDFLLDLSDHTTNGQITHQPAWGLLATLRLAGIEPDRRGYAIAPVLPLRRYSIDLPMVGITVSGSGMRGYLRTASTGPLRLRLDPPAGAGRRTARVFVDGRRVDARFEDGSAILRVRPGRDHLVRWRIGTRQA
jgi:Glycosyl hydrolase 36 superfamily, catalytic domain/Glycosyltransferase family 36